MGLGGVPNSWNKVEGHVVQYLYQDPMVVIF